MATNAKQFGLRVAAMMLPAALVCSYAAAGPAGVVDSFSGNLTAYQNTRILNNGAADVEQSPTTGRLRAADWSSILPTTLV